MLVSCPQIKSKSISIIPFPIGLSFSIKRSINVFCATPFTDACLKSSLSASERNPFIFLPYSIAIYFITDSLTILIILAGEMFSSNFKSTRFAGVILIAGTPFLSAPFNNLSNTALFPLPLFPTKMRIVPGIGSMIL